MNILERLREKLIDESGWDKMGRERPDDSWADSQINNWSNVELLEQLEFLNENKLCQFCNKEHNLKICCDEEIKYMKEDRPDIR